MTESTRMKMMDLFDDDNETCVPMTSLFPADYPAYKAEMNLTMATNRGIDKTATGLNVTFDHAVMCSEKRVTIL